MGERKKLGQFLNEVIHWEWSEFLKAEADGNRSSLEGAVFSLVRTASNAKLGAIRLAIDRIDGKVETPVNIVYPHVFLVYPEAKEVAGGEPSEQARLPSPEVEPEAEQEQRSLATASLRETLDAMIDAPRGVVSMVLDRKTEVEKLLKADPDLEIDKSPLVKSVIAANLLKLVENHNFEAITEVFDRIDGKLVETIRVLGDDILIPMYGEIAPAGSTLNENGVYQIESQATTSMWEEKFKNASKKNGS